MTKRELVAPPVGTIYQLRHHGWRAALRDNEYWQVERRTEKTVWLRQLVTNTEGKPILGMTRTDIPYVSAESSKMRACASVRACTWICTATSTGQQASRRRKVTKCRP